MQTQTSASTRVLEVSNFSVHWILLDRAPPDVSSLLGKTGSFYIFAIVVPLQGWILLPRLIRKLQRNSSKNDGTHSSRDKCDMEQ